MSNTELHTFSSSCLSVTRRNEPWYALSLFLTTIQKENHGIYRLVQKQRSGCWKKAQTSATRILSPPDNWFTFFCCAIESNQEVSKSRNPSSAVSMKCQFDLPKQGCREDLDFLFFNFSSEIFFCTF